MPVVGELRLERQLEARIVGSNVDPVTPHDESAQRLDMGRACEAELHRLSELPMPAVQQPAWAVGRRSPFGLPPRHMAELVGAIREWKAKRRTKRSAGGKVRT